MFMSIPDVVVVSFIVLTIVAGKFDFASLGLYFLSSCQELVPLLFL